jgi:hypothetical protein
MLISATKQGVGRTARAGQKVVRHPNNVGWLPSPVQKRLPKLPKDTRFMTHTLFVTRKRVHLTGALVMK